MIAEIGGEISHTGSNLTERLEDYLTGNGERMICNDKFFKREGCVVFANGCIGGCKGSLP